MLLCGLRPKQLQNYPICPCVRSGNILMDIVCQHWKLWDKRISRWSQRLCGGVEQMLRRIPIKSFLLRTTPFKSFCWLWINSDMFADEPSSRIFRSGCHAVPLPTVKLGKSNSSKVWNRNLWCHSRWRRAFSNKSEEEKSLKLRRRKKGNFKYFHKYPPPPLTH